MNTALLAAGLAVVAVGCDRGPTSPTPHARDIAPTVSISADRESDDGHGSRPVVTGDGKVDLTSAAAGFMKFEYDVSLRSDGSAEGEFSQARVAADSSGTVSFEGRATCVVVDSVNHRVWVGGVIAKNRSTSPAFRDGAIFQPGMDIWFRAVDYGEGHNDPADRSTTFGFQGSGGILTSADYCAAKVWPNTPVPDARTFPVSSGNIQVHDRAHGHESGDDSR
jgi:hypothetical protein